MINKPQTYMDSYCSLNKWIYFYLSLAVTNKSTINFVGNHTARNLRSVFSQLLVPVCQILVSDFPLNIKNLKKEVSGVYWDRLMNNPPWASKEYRQSNRLKAYSVSYHDTCMCFVVVRGVHALKSLLASCVPEVCETQPINIKLMLFFPQIFILFKLQKYLRDQSWLLKYVPTATVLFPTSATCLYSVRAYVDSCWGRLGRELRFYSNSQQYIKCWFLHAFVDKGYYSSNRNRSINLKGKKRNISHY